LAVFLSFTVQAEEERFDTLVINHQTYSNVVIQSRTKTHVFFVHNGGFGSAKLSDMPPAGMRALGYQAEEPAKKPASTASKTVTQIAPQLFQKTKVISGPFQAEILPVLQKFLWFIVGGLVLAHLILSFCFMLICRKAGKEAGPAIWLPLFQLFPLLKAANMSGWTFLLLFVPVVNIFAGLMWCIKICQALNKGAILGFLLFLPGIGLFVLFYLAFSGGGASDEPELIKLDYGQTSTSAD
jgi:hypothetical protein